MKFGNSEIRVDEGGIPMKLVSGNYTTHRTLRGVSEDDLATFGAAGYLNAGVNYFKKGDVIYMLLDVDGTPSLSTFVIEAVSDTDVTHTAQ